MLALPAADFAPDPGPAAPPLPAQWREAGSISHVFTHFRLTLAVLAAEVAAGTVAPDGTRFAPPDPSALPAVMRKALAAGLAALAGSPTRT
jgi:A/G-specific adenine glycosylase